jgi:hypothetical protein
MGGSLNKSTMTKSKSSSTDLPIGMIVRKTTPLYIKKEILSIVLCITKFQSDLLNKKFPLHVDCKSAKEVL